MDSLLTSEYPGSIALLLACLVATVAAAWDLKSRTIPNWLTYSALAAGIILAGLQGALVSSLAGTLIAGGCGVVLYLFRSMGGGDVKLLAALGSLLGQQLAWELLFFGLLFGGVWSIYVLCVTGNILQTLKGLWNAARSMIYPKVPVFIPAQDIHIAGGAVIAAAVFWITVSVMVSTVPLT